MKKDHDLDRPQPLSRSLTILVFALFAIIGIGLIGHGTRIVLKSKEASHWPRTEGRVISSTLKSEVDSAVAYIQYEYYLGSDTYISDRLFWGTIVKNPFSGCADPSIYLRNGKGLTNRQILKMFPAGKKIDVFYNPKKPTEAVLFQDARTQVYVSFLLGFGCFFPFILWLLCEKSIRARGIIEFFARHSGS
ncbi:MAG: DUF3592 domain-containing protein [Deltaproteobacteria bacterium]|nr:DUF3592 domain-containing protein [Deltaproteobacteria bacterium]